MHTERVSHRHFVALPLLAVLCFAILSVGNESSASLLDSGPKRETVASGPQVRTETIGKTISVSMDPFSSFQTDGSTHLVLDSGVFRITADRLASAHVADMDVYVLGGSMFVLRQTGSFIIASLDAPILVSNGKSSRLVASEHQLVIGSGQTIHTSAVSPLPGSWKLEQKKLLPPLETGVMEIAEDDPMHTLAAIRLSEQLPDETRAFIDALHDVMPSVSLDAYAAVRLLALPQSAESNDILSRMLAVSDPDALSWSHGLLVVASEHLLPDLALQDLSKLAKRSVVEKPQTATTLLLPLIDRTISNFERQGFPIYVRSLKQIKQEFTLLAHSLLGDKMPSSDIEEGTSAVNTVSWVDQHAIQGRARERLLSMGIDVTVQTSFETISQTKVRGIGLYFAGTSGDRLFDLTLDLETGKASDIVLDGKPLPNALPLERFLQSL